MDKHQPETVDLPVYATYYNDGREPELIYKPVPIKAVEELMIKLRETVTE